MKNTMKEEIEQHIRSVVDKHKKDVIEELPPLKEVVEFTEEGDLIKDISADEIKKTEE